jgi:hypothetical protein
MDTWTLQKGYPVITIDNTNNYYDDDDDDSNGYYINITQN